MNNPCTRTLFLLYDKNFKNIEEIVCDIVVIVFK